MLSERNMSRIFFVLCIIVSLIFIVNALGMEGEPMWVLGSGDYPILVGGIIIGLSLLALLLDFKKSIKGTFSEETDESDENDGTKAYNLVYIMIVSLLVYPVIIPILGFFSTTFLYLIFLCWLLSEKKISQIPVILAVAFGTTVACYITFSMFLDVIFPSGLLF